MMQGRWVYWIVNLGPDELVLEVHREKPTPVLGLVDELEWLDIDGLVWMERHPEDARFATFLAAGGWREVGRF